MGTGKTSWAIQEINNNPEKAFIFATPFLTEIDRIKDATNKPGGRKFYDPQKINGRKIDGFNYLLENGQNIALTHATFSNSNNETIEYLKHGRYTLILDEVLDILIPFNEIATTKLQKKEILQKLFQYHKRFLYITKNNISCS